MLLVPKYHCFLSLEMVIIKVLDCLDQGRAMNSSRMEEGRRRVLTLEKVSVIREVLTLLLAVVKSESTRSPGALQRLEALAWERCDRLILDLRTAIEPAVGVPPGIGNLCVSRLGEVLVVTGEVSTPEIYRKIRALNRSPLRSRFLNFGHAASLPAIIRTLL